jgi:methionyl-tRNA synthetase
LGIELPFDKNYVTYVWFDALLNYLSGINYGDGDTWGAWWANCEHLIAKDILKPHGVYWPIMLHAADFPIFQHLTVHGYWNFRDAKISKSSGKPVGTEPLLRVFGVDAVRYFLLREMVFGLDASFSVDAMVKRINSDLANDLGNLFSRVAKLIGDFFGGKIPPSCAPDPELLNVSRKLMSDAPDWVAEHKWHVLLEEVMQFVRATNRYFESSAPWSLVKSDMVAAGNVLYNCAEALRIAAVSLHPIMPGKMTELLSRMGEPIEKFEWTSAMKWGLARSGAAMQKGDALFPRIDEAALPALLPEFYTAQTDSKSPAPKSEVPLLDLEDFRKLELRSAVVTAAEKISGSDKLLKLQVDIGGAQRQIVAGVAQYYSPEQMIGKHIVVVANLKPAKLRGEISEGMLLAVKWDNKLQVINLGEAVPPGSSIS